MMSTKKILQMARKWRNLASISHKRFAVLRTKDGVGHVGTDKGHCVVYTTGQTRFVIPLAYLQNRLVQELLQMAEEEFGLPSNAPITLPCEAIFMDYAIYLIKKGAAYDLKKALLMSTQSGRCSSSSSLQRGQADKDIIIFQYQAVDVNFTGKHPKNFSRLGIH